MAIIGVVSWCGTLWARNTAQGRFVADVALDCLVVAEQLWPAAVAVAQWVVAGEAVVALLGR